MLGIRKERKRRGWTLTELTRRTGIATSDLSSLERGLRPVFPGWRRKLTRVFGVRAHDLFGEVADEDVSGDAGS